MSLLVRCVGVVVGFGLSSCVFVVSDDGIELPNGVRGSGVHGEEVRPVAAFHAVRLETRARVELAVGPVASLSVSGDDNVVPAVVTRVENGTLVIELPGAWNPRRELALKLTTPALDSFRIEGSGDVTIDGLATDRLELAIQGSGSLRARGRASDVRASIEGSGSLDLDELTAERAELEIDGSGAIEAAVTNGLHYSIEGSGSIAYSGTATTHGTISGSGNLVRRN